MRVFGTGSTVATVDVESIDENFRDAVMLMRTAGEMLANAIVAPEAGNIGLAVLEASIRSAMAVLNMALAKICDSQPQWSEDDACF